MPVSDGFAARCFLGTACRFPLTCGIEDSPAAPRGIPPKIQRVIFGSPSYERMCPSACGLQPAFADNFPETEQELHAQRTAFARMLPAAFCCGGHFPMCGLPAGGTPSDRRKFSVNRRFCAAFRCLPWTFRLRAFARRLLTHPNMRKARSAAGGTVHFPHRCPQSDAAFRARRTALAGASRLSAFARQSPMRWLLR